MEFVLDVQFLIAYAGPASSVRVERVSRDRYKDGGALAEVVSSFDTMGDSISNDTPEEENAELEGKTKRQFAIEVRFQLSLFMRYMVTMFHAVKLLKIQQYQD